MKAENKKTRKKFRLGILVKALVALVLVTAMTLSLFMTTGTAEFVKSLSAKLDFAATPSGPYMAKLIAANYSGDLYYDNFKNITQAISFDDGKPPIASSYEIKLPVTDSGLYKIDFAVRIEGGSSYINTGTSSGATKVSLNYAVGCKVNTHRTGFSGNPTTLITEAATKRNYNTQRVYGPDPYGIHTNHGQSGSINYSVPGVNGTTQYCHDYQWKTLAPARLENVSLTFYLPAGNVALWAWDFRGLSTGSSYTMYLSDISITKIDTPDSDEPYLDFPDTHYINNALLPDASDPSTTTIGNGGTQLLTVQDKGEIKGAAEAGKTRTSVGRGTYLTEATYNSMTMQAEALVFGYHGVNLVNSVYVENNTSWGDSERYTNLVVFGIPIKNVKSNKKYKVTFDVSFARQGYAADHADNQQDVDNLSAEERATYAPASHVFERKATMGTMHFQSYLYNGMVDDQKGAGTTTAPWTDNGLGAVYNIIGVTADYLGRGNFKDSSKMLYTEANMGAAVTRFDNITNINSQSGEDITYSTTSSVNNLYNTNKTTADIDYWYNTLNAVAHTEYNGQNAINWITFTNTTFSFSTANYTDAELANLRWMWAIDAFVPKSWNRIKFENVRIEEVTTYGSNVSNNGLTFNGTAAGFTTYEELGLYRGANGTGQNHAARNDRATDFPLAKMNIFAPVYDASAKTVVTSGGEQRIGLTGYAVCKGGVEKYVWSADDGKTWYDMESQYLSDITNDTILNLAEHQAENSITGLYKMNCGTNGVQNQWGNYAAEKVDFLVSSGDGKNAQYNIVANLKGTPYEGAFNLDIIFAAVPCSNPDARCEIMRITNYNELANYRTSTLEIESDIEVTVAGNKLNATYETKATLSGNAPENVEAFSVFNGYNYKGTCTQSEGYSKRVDSFSKYEELPTTFANIPVKNKLTIRGYAMVQHGVSDYYWSVDYGKTWNACSSAETASVAEAAGYCDLDSDDDCPFGPLHGATLSQRNYWYDGSTAKFTTTDNYDFLEKLWFCHSGHGLTADLSDYVGQTVDVIFAGKSNYNGTYCPVGRIDNVAVYGDPGEEVVGKRGAGPGPFFVHYDLSDGGGDICKVYDRNNNIVSRIPFESSLVSGWTNAVNSNKLTSMEVYNATFGSMRAYNKTPVEVKEGYSITPHGWMICHGGVAHYKYSFDGGETWTVIKTGNDNYLLEDPGDAEAMVSYAVAVDSTFTSSEDAKGGGFRYTFSGAFTQNVISSPPLKVPSGITGRCNLQVVAVSNRGYTYPVVSIALNITS